MSKTEMFILRVTGMIGFTFLFLGVLGSIKTIDDFTIGLLAILGCVVIPILVCIVIKP